MILHKVTDNDKNEYNTKLEISDDVSMNQSNDSHTVKKLFEMSHQDSRRCLEKNSMNYAIKRYT